MSSSRPKPEPTDPASVLAALREATNACRECPLGERATRLVFGEGPVGAVVMVVGEQPGNVEDLQGRPFVGPAGRLFDQAAALLRGDPEERESAYARWLEDLAVADEYLAPAKRPPQKL